MMLSLASERRYCFNVLVVVLLCSAVLLSMLYSLAQHFSALHHEFWTQYTNHSRRHDAVRPSGYFPHSTHPFHPLNEHGVRRT